MKKNQLTWFAALLLGVVVGAGAADNPAPKTTPPKATAPKAETPKATAPKAATPKNVAPAKATASPIDSIDWTKPALGMAVGYLFEGGSSTDDFLKKVQSAYSGSKSFSSGKGGITFNVDFLWDMKPVVRNLYAGVGIGFLQAAGASWSGWDPVWDWSSTWGDYTCGYYVIPIELKAKYYFLTPGLFAKAGLGVGVENVSYHFKGGSYDLSDSDSSWHSSTKVNSGTGAGFAVDVGIGYEYEFTKGMVLGGVLDGYFYSGKVSVLSLNPKISFGYKL